MLKYSTGPLSAKADKALSDLQAKVDAEPDHASRYAKASRLFDSKSPKSAFDEVRQRLAEISPPGDACFYCERDRYRDIEHIKPKRHYPEKCFSWENYVYACAICNQDRKGDVFAVFDSSGNVVRFDRSHPKTMPVPAGDPVFIDIRHEDPLDFLILDLDTGRFVAVGSDRDKTRGAFTRDLLELDADVLARIRRQAAVQMRDWLKRHAEAVRSGDLSKAKRIQDEIKDLQQPTVLVEMRRQASKRPGLEELFAALPPEIGQRP